jgi:uncharacterized protein with FMN-binding domain
MRKALVVILAVATLGIIAVYNNGNKSDGVGANKIHPAATSNTTNQSSAGTTSTQQTSGYKDGTYTGGAADTPYGTVQVAAVVSGGKITDIKFLQMPYLEGHSREVTSVAEPYLKQSAIANQSASVDFISGATSTVYGFEQSMQAALDQAARA